jgi:hypothetical protein
MYKRTIVYTGFCITHPASVPKRWPVGQPAQFPPARQGNRAKTLGILPLNILTPSVSLTPRKPDVQERLQNPMLHPLLPSCTLEKQKRIVDPALVEGRGVAFSEGRPNTVADSVAGRRGVLDGSEGRAVEMPVRVEDLELRGGCHGVSLAI